MPYNFDEIISRRNSDSIKWCCYPQDVLPFWIADMDFQSPQPVIDAIQRRVDQGFLGYPADSIRLKEVICHRLWKLYSWKVEPDEIMFIPGVVVGFNFVIQALTNPQEAILYQTPVYPPFLRAGKANNIQCLNSPLLRSEDLDYTINFDGFSKTITPQTSMFLFCNPHNPVGRVYRPDELEKLAEICLENNLFICSDEIHADLIFQGHYHTPIASLNPEISAQTVTLMAPSKTYNIAGLCSSYAIVQNPDLMKKMKSVAHGMVGNVNLLGFTATEAAYRSCDDWLSELLLYLEENYKFLVHFFEEKIPEIKVTPIEGTYLAWLDCRALNLPQSPYEFFLTQAKVAMNDGKSFGAGGEGFLRMNFGCPRGMLQQGLQQMEQALKE